MRNTLLIWLLTALASVPQSGCMDPVESATDYLWPKDEAEPRPRTAQDALDQLKARAAAQDIVYAHLSCEWWHADPIRGEGGRAFACEGCPAVLNPDHTCDLFHVPAR